jgi:hypothetical protein
MLRNLTDEEIQFLEQNSINFETIKLGYVRNIPFDILHKYEQIYRKYIDCNYVCTYWCSHCVMEMLSRLMYHFDEL